MAGVLCGLVSTGMSAAAPPGLPDPCTAVPSADIAAAFGLKSAPPSTLATVRNVSTCSFGSGQLTVSVGYTTIANPAVPAQVTLVAGLPHGTFMTYKGSTQSEILFYKGSAATGVYGVVRNFASIGKLKLETIAKALYSGMTGQPGTATGPSVNLVSG